MIPECAQLPKNTSDWNIAEWVYQASRLDVSGYTNTEPFLAALEKAKALRDSLGVTRVNDVTNYANASDIDISADTLSYNLINGITPEINFYNGAEIVPLEAVNMLYASNGLFDGDTQVAGTDYANDGSYLELVYDLDGTANIKDILVAHTENAALRNLKYNIYTSSNRGNLFTTDNLLIIHENSEGSFAQKFSFGTATNVECRYIAIRIYKPAIDESAFDGIVRLSELGVYGSVQKWKVTNGDFTDEEVAKIGTNLMKDRANEIYFYDGRMKEKLSQAFGNTGYKAQTVVDGGTRTPVGIGTDCRVSSADDELNVFIYFKLDDVYTIEKILINHFWQKYLQTGKYEIYVSNSMNTLFKASSRVVEYNNMEDGPYGSNVSQLFEFEGSVVGRFVAYKIIFPLTDYEKAVAAWGEGNMYFRHTEFGIYGKRYIKPLKQVNLLNHTPVEAYRTDADGKRENIPQTEFGANDYTITTNGLYDSAANVMQNGKTLDFVFDLCSDAELTSVALNTLTENIKKFKVYAADGKDGLWEENNLVFNYTGDATSKAEKLFAETSLGARYLRFSIPETITGTVDITEFEAIGWNTYEFDYINLVEENSSRAEIYLEDKEDYYLNNMDFNANKQEPSWGNYYPWSNAFDTDVGTVSDLYGGENNKESINILLDLETMNAVDSINVKAGSTPDYWPSKLNFYIGETDMEIFGKDAKPVASFDSKSEADVEGNFRYTALPTVAQYVRIEILEGSHKYYNDVNNMILAVIDSIEVKGLELVGKADEEGVVARFSDKETGIRVEIMAKTPNDVYYGAKSILVTQRELTKEEKEILKSKGAAAVTKMFEIYLLDGDGNIVEDIGGRDLRVKIPKSFVSDPENTYIANSFYGFFELIELDSDIQTDEYFVITALDTNYMKYALTQFVSLEDDIIDTDNEDIVIEEDDTDDVIDTDNEDNFFEEDEDSEEDNEENDEDEYKTLIKKVRRPKKNAGFDYLWIIITAGAVIVVASAALIIYLIIKKKKKDDGEVQ